MTDRQEHQGEAEPLPSSPPQKQPSDETTVGLPPTLGERRSENEILQLKLPKILRGASGKDKTVDSAVLMESEAYSKALSRRLEIKNIVIATIAEFFGTFGFMFFGEAIVTRAMNTGNGGTPTLEAQLFASLGIAFSLW